MFYPKYLNNSNIYTIIIARSNKNRWMKYVYVVGFVLIKYMWNKSYGELRFYVRFQGILWKLERFFGADSVLFGADWRFLLLFSKSINNN